MEGPGSGSARGNDQGSCAEAGIETEEVSGRYCTTEELARRLETYRSELSPQRCTRWSPRAAVYSPWRSRVHTLSVRERDGVDLDLPVGLGQG